MNWKIIFNPFAKFSETSLLIFGIAITIIGSWIGAHFGVVFDGVIDVHASETNFLESLKFNFINVASVFFLLFALGKLVNPKTRWIDILNTALIARFPLYILGIFTNNEKMEKITDKLMEGMHNPEIIPISGEEMAVLMLFSLAALLFLAYKITLLVFGFKTATNTKKWQHWLLFAIAILLAEILSKFLIYNL